MTIDQVYPVSADTQVSEAEIELMLEDSGGEITPIIQAKINELAKAERVQDLANSYHRLDALARAKAAELGPIIEALQAEIAQVEKRRDRVKSWITMAVPPGKTLTTDAVSVWYRESTAVDVTDAESIPIEFTRVKMEPDKRAIGEALKSGQQVPGAQLRLNYSLQVDHAGERAKANAKARERKKSKQVVNLEQTLVEG